MRRGSKSEDKVVVCLKLRLGLSKELLLLVIPFKRTVRTPTGEINAWWYMRVSRTFYLFMHSTRGVPSSRAPSDSS